ARPRAVGSTVVAGAPPPTAAARTTAESTRMHDAFIPLPALYPAARRVVRAVRVRRRARERRDPTLRRAAERHEEAERQLRRVDGEAAVLCDDRQGQLPGVLARQLHAHLRDAEHAAGASINEGPVLPAGPAR